MIYPDAVSVTFSVYSICQGCHTSRPEQLKLAAQLNALAQGRDHGLLGSDVARTCHRSCPIGFVELER